MLVINLKYDSHKVIDSSTASSESDSSTDSSVYSAPSPKRKVSKKSTRVSKTVLTDEQKKYLNMYETMHDEIFHSSESKDSSTNDSKPIKVKVYALVDKSDLEKEEIESTEQQSFESNVNETNEQEEFDIFVSYYKELEDLESEIEESPDIEDLEEYDSILNEEEYKDSFIEKKSLWKKFITFIQNIFKRKQK